MSDVQPAIPVPAATILMLRDGAEGLEVFMVKRHHQIDFVAGALVFPGGKVHAGDREAGLSDVTDGAGGWPAEMHVVGVAAIREAFEESGILLARDESGALVSPDHLARLQPHRAALEKNELSLLDLLRREKLRLACDLLVRFAHWITPEHMPKRFDTHFFLAAAPEGHLAAHDGCESVDSVWIRPDAAIADRKKWNVVFPTKLNLMKLAEARTVDEAMARARANPPVTVMPWVEQTAEGQMLRIRNDAGYAQTSVRLRDAL
ncbi:MAG: NUDIX domain-containing protein [Alphaproteobacteria bacterium]|nr:NUDIX domain-containing protein [Alphaproteobacteria bacterium]